MIIAQLAMCEECRDGTCDACERYKRRLRDKRRREARKVTQAPKGWTSVEVDHD